MSVNIVHLVSGEQLISKVTELRDENGEPFCFLLTMPMLLTLIPGETEADTKINYLPWSPFSSSPEFRVGFDKIVSIGDPTGYIFETYIELNQPKYPILSQEELEQFQQTKREKIKND